MQDCVGTGLLICLSQSPHSIDNSFAKRGVPVPNAAPTVYRSGVHRPDEGCWPVPVSAGVDGGHEAFQCQTLRAVSAMLGLPFMSVHILSYDNYYPVGAQNSQMSWGLRA